MDNPASTYENYTLVYFTIANPGQLLYKRVTGEDELARYAKALTLDPTVILETIRKGWLF